MVYRPVGIFYAALSLFLVNSMIVYAIPASRITSQPTTVIVFGSVPTFQTTFPRISTPLIFGDIRSDDAASSAFSIPSSTLGDRSANNRRSLPPSRRPGFSVATPRPGLIFGNLEDVVSNQRQNPPSSRSFNPSRGFKYVFTAECVYCNVRVSNRCMKAARLCDSSSMISTDETFNVEYYPEEFVRSPSGSGSSLGSRTRLFPAPTTILPVQGSRRCVCETRDIGCKSCGNLMGYHIQQPCQECLSGTNNGHFWILFEENILLNLRFDSNFPDGLQWKDIVSLREIPYPFLSIGR